MTDPWSVQSSNVVQPQSKLVNESNEVHYQHKTTDLENDCQHLGFEDSFIQDNNSNQLEDKNTADWTEHKPLPDSETYLRSLERKLEKLKKTPKLVDALSEKRDDCMRSMLTNSSSVCNNEQLLELEASIINTDSAVQNLYRQLHPVQPVTVGETVHIVNYDQLEEQRLETEDKEELEENSPASR